MVDAFLKPNVRKGGRRGKIAWNWTEPKFSDLLLYAQNTFFWYFSLLLFSVFFLPSFLPFDVFFPYLSFFFFSFFLRTEDKARQTLDPVLKKRKEAGKKSKTQMRLNFFPVPKGEPQFESKRLEQAVKVVKEKKRKEKEKEKTKTK